MSLDVEEKYGLSKDDLKLILSNIFNLTID